MFRFAKLDGTNFSLDDITSIGAFDSNDRIVAKLVENTRHFHNVNRSKTDQDDDLLFKFAIEGTASSVPENVDDWEFCLNGFNEDQERIILRQIVIAWLAIAQTEYLVCVFEDTDHDLIRTIANPNNDQRGVRNVSKKTKLYTPYHILFEAALQPIERFHPLATTSS